MSPESDSVIDTDGCTGFPDSLFGRDFTACCTVHDEGGSDVVLLNCLNEAVGDEWWFLILVFLAVLLMKTFRPVYNLLQKWGWLPKTKGSKF